MKLILVVLLATISFQGLANYNTSGIGPAPTIVEANLFFISEGGPTAWNATPGFPTGFHCGPSSWWMGAAALGLLRHPNPFEAQRAITYLAKLTPHPQGRSTSGQVLLNGIQKLSSLASGKSIDGSLSEIDAALLRGNPVIIRGAPRDAWGIRLSSEGKYLWNFSVHHQDFEHWSIIFGKRSDGLYIIGDPMSSVGSTLASGKEIELFLILGAARFNNRESWELFVRTP